MGFAVGVNYLGHGLRIIGVRFQESGGSKVQGSKVEKLSPLSI